ncbi:MAG: PD40 domain-containing protein [Chloroflexi bacterium]|nr:PD40 domain-containing protein [Chloroflexota bacterium]
MPRLLPDGRVGFLQRCEGSRTPARRIPEEAVSLLVTDLAGTTTTRLVPYYLPFGANVFDVAPDQSAGIINDGQGLYERLQWLRPLRLEPLALPLERAGRPRWSPDGRWIAFGGAAPVAGRPPDGVDRLDLPKQLYRLAVATGEMEVLVDDATWVGLPAWSPDGRWLLVGMHLRGGQRGLWLVEPATRRRVWLLEGGDIGGASWALDGRSIVVTMEAVPAVEPRDEKPRGLLRYELPPLDTLLPTATMP